MIPISVRGAWRKSTYSGGQGGDCVEISPSRSDVGVRDTKRREAGGFYVSRSAWATFIENVKDRATA